MDLLNEIAQVAIYLAGAWQVGTWLGHSIIWLFCKIRKMK